MWRSAGKIKNPPAGEGGGCGRTREPKRSPYVRRSPVAREKGKCVIDDNASTQLRQLASSLRSSTFYSQTAWGLLKVFG